MSSLASSDAQAGTPADPGEPPAHPSRGILAALNTSTKPPCIVGRWLAAQPTADRDGITEWLAAGKAKSAVIRVARDRGYDGSPAMWYAHTLGDCSCPRPQKAAA